ncbi:MAG: NCS1 family nucleobase:cation symporter-1 [Gammaproteobacteria bacterium]|nr:NCS1 family nucleobase:cation symporter-1 [Gammaproteobacteria bacterium]
MTRQSAAPQLSIEETPLYSPDLAPVTTSRRTWNTLSFAAVWVGMAACIPTYLLASYMIRSGLLWWETLTIILVANIIVTVPMTLNGHAGTKYGVPFAVLGRAPFGTVGVHVPALARALVGCGWFGVQAWIGGLAIHAIVCTLLGQPVTGALTTGKFVAFAFSWAITLYFIWRGTESIRRLETLAAPVLIGVGLLLLIWASNQGGGFARVLAQSAQLERPTAQYRTDGGVSVSPLRGLGGDWKADHYRIAVRSGLEQADWRAAPIGSLEMTPSMVATLRDSAANPKSEDGLVLQFRHERSVSTPIPVSPASPTQNRSATWLFWITAMVGFWATMSISIADITRYGKSQRAQVTGQFLGLPTTMLLYSFVSVFVTCAALTAFEDVIVAEDAPWDPVSLVAQFQSPAIVIATQLLLFVATLTTNIAANVIAPANAFANLCPKAISLRTGGLITGLIGIVIAPWLLFDRISELLVFVSGLLGPVLGVMLADYYYVRRTRISLGGLFDPHGAYRYRTGFNPAAMVALAAGVATALVGYFIPSLEWLYIASWFSGFIVSSTLYIVLSLNAAKRALENSCHC